jgi:hypothetical protein
MAEPCLRLGASAPMIPPTRPGWPPQRHAPMHSRPRRISFHRGASGRGAVVEFVGPIEGLADPAAHGIPLATAPSKTFADDIWERQQEARAALVRAGGPRTRVARMAGGETATIPLQTAEAEESAAADAARKDFAATARCRAGQNLEPSHELWIGFGRARLLARRRGWFASRATDISFREFSVIHAIYAWLLTHHGRRLCLSTLPAPDGYQNGLGLRGGPVAPVGTHGTPSLQERNTCLIQI